VRRGEKNQQQQCYFNLRKKAASADENDLHMKSLDSLEPPKGWTVLKGHNNEVITYLKVQDSIFMSRRQIIELKVFKASHNKQLSFHLKHHGCEVDLEELLKFGSMLNSTTIKEQVKSVLDLVTTSSICPGVLLEEGEAISTSVPHITGRYQLQQLPNVIDEEVAFSAACQVLSGPESLCSVCAQLQRTNKQKKKRKNERMEISPNTNKRYGHIYGMMHTVFVFVERAQNILGGTHNIHT